MSITIEEAGKRVVDNLDKWIHISMDDLEPLMLYQKVELSLEEFLSYLSRLEEVNQTQEVDHFKTYVWSQELRDFSILLRDSLLAGVKFDQLRKDRRLTRFNVLAELHETLKSAASQLKGDYLSGNAEVVHDSNFQLSPIPDIVAHIEELEIQTKKIYRSYDKVDDLRIELNEFKKDFHFQFQRQVSVVSEIEENILNIRDTLDGLYPDATKAQIAKALESISAAFQKIESYQGLDSLEILAYHNYEELHIPSDVRGGELLVKHIEPKYELSQWFSSSIYPKVIELENRRNINIEKALGAINQIRTRLAGLILDEKEVYTVSETKAKRVLSRYINDSLNPLIHDQKEIAEAVNSEIDENLLASNIYSKDQLLFPSDSNALISNMSRDALSRFLHYTKLYRKKTKDFVYDKLSKYFQMQPTPVGAFVANKLIFNEENEKYSLFLKKGFLGRSFTVPRPKITNSILQSLHLWQKGVLESVLLYGPTGAGKSTIVGMLANGNVNEEIIHLRAGEVTFVSHSTIPPTYDLNKVLEEVKKRTIDKKIVVTIDDLEHWHNGQHSLFDNINDLFTFIAKYKNRMFIIVTCGHYLRDRMIAFRDLSTVFTNQISVECMSTGDIKKALAIREKAVPELSSLNDDYINSLDSVSNLSKGNIGLAMIEYCRVQQKDYNITMKSFEFNNLVTKYAVLLEYIISKGSVSISELHVALHDSDFRDTLKSIDQLCGQKILSRPKDGIITVNPLIIHFIERELDRIS